MKVKIDGTKYSRDINNMAVLCTDKSVVAKYQNDLLVSIENKRRDNEINKLKQDISEIKTMLKALIDRGQNG